MIMVTGVSGQLGSGILASLEERGRAVIGASSVPTRGFRHLDFDRPESLDLVGVTTLVLVSAGYEEDDQVIARHGAVVDAGRRDGVEHVVYTSLVTEGDHLGFALAHRATEQLIAASGLNWTIMRNGLYAELFGGLMSWTSDGILESPFGDAALAAVVRNDLAEAIAMVATSPGQHACRHYDLVAQAITSDDVARSLGVNHRTIGLEEYRRRLLATDGLLPFQPPMLMSIASSVRHGFLRKQSKDLEQLLGRSPVNPLTIAATSALANREAR